MTLTHINFTLVHVGQPGMIVRPTVEELVDPNGLYTKRRIDVTSDPVGYGFVIRGSRPVYVHTVDPNGPAAAAGLQVSLIKEKYNYLIIQICVSMIITFNRAELSVCVYVLLSTITKCQCGGVHVL